MITVYYSSTTSPRLQRLTKPRVGSWIHVVAPTETDLERLGEMFGLDQDLLNDAIDLYESPRIEREDGSVYVFTRYCYPEGSDIATEPLLVILKKDLMVTVLRTDSAVLDRLFHGNVRLITTQRTKAFLQILVEINSSYERHIHKISRKTLTIRGQLRKSEMKNEDFIDFIDIEEDLNEFLSALQAQAVMLRTLLGGRYLKLFEEDRDLIEDLSLGTNELIELAKTRLKTLSNIREAYSTIAANTLNRIFKNLTSIGIFLTVPMIAAAFYGMNVALPLATHPQAFWIISTVALGLTIGAIWLFRRKRWL